MSTPEKEYSASTTTVMLLAAGKGKRMLPLTKHHPKPLLKVGEHSLIEHHLIRLSNFGFKQIVINTAYLGTMIHKHLGNGECFGLNIEYSDESISGALETAGGLAKALPLIESDPFLVINADIWTDFDFTALLKPLEKAGRLVMVTNPSHNQSGDFSLDENNLLINKLTSSSQTLTFSGIALYRKKIYADLAIEKQALLPIFNTLIDKQQLEGQAYSGIWNDIGTPDRLNSINQMYAAAKSS